MFACQIVIIQLVNLSSEITSPDVNCAYVYMKLSRAPFMPISSMAIEEAVPDSSRTCMTDQLASALAIILRRLYYFQITVIDRNTTF